MTSGWELTREQAMLHVDTVHLAPASQAFRDAADRVSTIVEQSRWNLHIEPAMTDPISIGVADVMTRHHVTSDGSIVNVLARYREELLRIADALDATRLAYERGEAANADRFT